MNALFVSSRVIKSKELSKLEQKIFIYNTFTLCPLKGDISMDFFKKYVFGKDIYFASNKNEF